MRQASDDMSWFEAQDPAYVSRHRRYRYLNSDEIFLRRALTYGAQANDEEITRDTQNRLRELKCAGNGRTFFY